MRIKRCMIIDRMRNNKNNEEKDTRRNASDSRPFWLKDVAWVWWLCARRMTRAAEFALMTLAEPSHWQMETLRSHSSIRNQSRDCDSLERDILITHWDTRGCDHLHRLFALPTQKSIQKLTMLSKREKATSRKPGARPLPGLSHFRLPLNALGPKRIRRIINTFVAFVVIKSRGASLIPRVFDCYHFYDPPSNMAHSWFSVNRPACRFLDLAEHQSSSFFNYSSCQTVSSNFFFVLLDLRNYIFSISNKIYGLINKKFATFFCLNNFL